jgi:hypothetical protein
MTKPFHYPPELIFHICGFVYSSGLPAPSDSLDPVVLSTENGVNTDLPSPSGSWSEPIARRTLANLCLVNHVWYAGAKPWLWRKLEVRLPRSWLGIIDEVVGIYDLSTSKQNAVNIGESIKAAADAVLASSPVANDFEHNCALVDLEERILKRLNSLDSPVPPELLSPPASRDPSPTRSDSNAQGADRWRLMKNIRNAVQDIVQDNEPGVYSNFLSLPYSRTNP